MSNITIDIPDVSTVAMPAAIYRSVIEGERQAAAESANTEANKLRTELEAIAEALPIAAEGGVLAGVLAMLAEMKELEVSNHDQSEVLKKALARIEELEALPVIDDPMPDTVPIITIPDPVIVPPVVMPIPPATTPPIVEPIPNAPGEPPEVVPLKWDAEKRTYSPMYGVYIVDGGADIEDNERARQEANLRREARHLKDIDYLRHAGLVNAAAIYQSITEVRRGRIFDYLRAAGIAPLMDTMQAVLKRLSETELEEYCHVSFASGAWGYIIDDADTMVKLADGTPDRKASAALLSNYVTRLRRFSSPLPIIASVSAGADMDEFGKLCDVLAVQCYRIGEGLKPAETFAKAHHGRIVSPDLYTVTKGGKTTTPEDYEAQMRIYNAAGCDWILTYTLRDDITNHYATDIRSRLLSAPPTHLQALELGGKQFWQRHS